MASKLKLTELLYPTSTTAAITINSDDSVTIPTQSTTNLAYTGTLTGGTGVVNLGSGQFYKDASGNVGIGTSSPTGKLHVNGGTFDSFTISGNSANSVGARFQNSAASSRNWNIGSSGGGPSPAGSFFIYDDTASATRMSIDSSGNVGIGTASPAEKLDVVGNIKLSGNLVVANAQGIDFSATSGTGTSELLDDYEEGTFTPTVTAAIGTITTLANVSGAYTKIGNLVYLSISFQITNIGTGSGSVDIANLPFSGVANRFAGVAREIAVNGVTGSVYFNGATSLGLANYVSGTAIVANAYWLISVSYLV